MKHKKNYFAKWNLPRKETDSLTDCKVADEWVVTIELDDWFSISELVTFNPWLSLTISLPKSSTSDTLLSATTAGLLQCSYKTFISLFS